MCKTLSCLSKAHLLKLDFAHFKALSSIGHMPSKNNPAFAKNNSG